MKSWRPWLVLLTAILLLVANVFLAPMRRALHGHTERVARSNLTLHVRCAGVLQAKNVQLLRSRTAAPVLKKYVEEGDFVKNGQLLLTFDEDVLRKELKQSQEQLRDAAREYAKAKREVTIQRRLFGYGAVPKKNIEDAQTARDRAQVVFESAQKNELERFKGLYKTKVYSPMAGYVITDFIKKDLSAPADKELFAVGTLNSFRVEADVDEIDLSKIALGQDVEIKVDAFPDAPLPGKVIAVAPKAERSAFAKVAIIIDVLDLKGLSLRPNLSVEVKVATGRLQSVMTIPDRALTRKGGQDWVWVIGKTGRTFQEKVALGESSEDRIVVKAGVEEGMVVLLPN